MCAPRTCLPKKNRTPAIQKNRLALRARYVRYAHMFAPPIINRCPLLAPPLFKSWCRHCSSPPPPEFTSSFQEPISKCASLVSIIYEVFRVIGIDIYTEGRSEFVAAGYPRHYNDNLSMWSARNPFFLLKKRNFEEFTSKFQGPIA